MFNLLKVALYIALSIIAFHFVCANFSLMDTTTHTGIQTNENIRLNNNEMGNGTIDDRQKQEIIRELEDYSRQTLNESDRNAKEITFDLKKKYAFKSQTQSVDTARDGIFNKVLKYVSPVTTTHQKAPSLENFSDYAPTTLPMIKNNETPILLTNKIVPNYMEIDKTNYHDQSTPMALNEFDTIADSNFKSEKTDNGSNIFVQKPMAFKSFDDISKSDIVDPSEWDRIAKKKESQSPLLSMKCLVPDQSGFLPSNHYDINNVYSNLLS